MKKNADHRVRGGYPAGSVAAESFGPVPTAWTKPSRASKTSDAPAKPARRTTPRRKAS